MHSSRKPSGQIVNKELSAEVLTGSHRDQHRLGLDCG
jgi:hypothetical protein